MEDLGQAILVSLAIVAVAAGLLGAIVGAVLW